MTYVPPHLRGETTRTSSPPPPEYRRQPQYPHTPQPQRSGRSAFARSETPNFFSSRGPRGVVRNRWAHYVDSREDPRRAEKRAEWICRTAAERQKLEDDPAGSYDGLKIDITGKDLPDVRFDSFLSARRRAHAQRHRPRRRARHEHPQGGLRVADARPARDDPDRP